MLLCAWFWICLTWSQSYSVVAMKFDIIICCFYLFIRIKSKMLCLYFSIVFAKLVVKLKLKTGLMLAGCLFSQLCEKHFSPTRRLKIKHAQMSFLQQLARPMMTTLKFSPCDPPKITWGVRNMRQTSLGFCLVNLHQALPLGPLCLGRPKNTAPSIIGTLKVSRGSEKIKQSLFYHKNRGDAVIIANLKQNVLLLYT